MKLSELKNILAKLNNIDFELADGILVPSHFHLTEVGTTYKKFIDCGGALRNEKFISFQLWVKDDYKHRLKPEKLISIIRLSEEQLKLEDLEIEVEYQTHTIGKYSLDFKRGKFILISKKTACLAEDKCVISINKKPKNNMSALGQNTCKSNSGCC
ncbi:MAG: DUF6428 family protein [Tenacibaculum sp.]